MPDLSVVAQYGSGVPRVDVTVTGLAAGDTITLRQESAAGAIVVRGFERAFASGGFFGTDFELPGGVNVTYRAEVFNAAGASQGFTNAATTQVFWDSSLVWIQDPLDPSAAVMVEAKGDFAEVSRRSRKLQVHQIGDRTVALMGQMGLLEDVSLRVQTQTLADADMLDDILSRTQVLVRTMPGIVRIPQCLNVVVPSPAQVPMDVQYGGEWIVWDLQGMEVSRSSLEIIVPSVSWQTIIDRYPTWQAVIDAFPTWLDVQKVT